jgi:hypothetical protein
MSAGQLRLAHAVFQADILLAWRDSALIGIVDA